MPRQRLPELDRAKGIGIFLVVLGHILGRGRIPGNDWFMFVEDLVYRFHMPFFMFLSGVVMGMTVPAIGTLAEYRRYLRNRAERLVPGYLLFAILIFLGKVLAARFVHVDNPVIHLGDFLTIFYAPMRSYSSYLWYVYALFLLCAALPPIELVLRRSSLALLGVSAILHAIPIPGNTIATQFCEYLLYFAIGVVAGRHLPRFTGAVDRLRWISLALFVAVLIVGVFQRMPKTLLGLLSIPALYGVARWKPSGAAGLLERWGRLSYPIYLMNTIFIGLTKAVIFKFVSWEGWHFFFFIPVLVTAGLVLPMMVRERVFARIPLLERITR